MLHDVPCEHALQDWPAQQYSIVLIMAGILIWVSSTTDARATAHDQPGALQGASAPQQGARPSVSGEEPTCT